MNPPARALPQPPDEYGESDLGYNEYLKVPQLLELQVPLSRPEHQDELFFIVIHQAYELWFKLVLHELEDAIQHMEAGRAPAAHHRVRRCVRVQELLVKQIHLLETLRPADFLKFRDHLKPASGFQSLQFREIEFVVGLKEPAYYRFFEDRPDMVARLKQRADSADLGTAFAALLRRRGFDVPTTAHLASDPGTPDHEALEGVLLELYEDPLAHPDLYQLAEALLDLDEGLALWREHHVRVVERIIGFKRGTGGSSGVKYLQSTTSKKAFPVLWDLRTRLGGAA